MFTLSWNFSKRGNNNGNLYHKSNLIFGPALIRAYELESKYAIYPRIIVDDQNIKEGTVFSIDLDGLTFINTIGNFDFCNYLYTKLYNISDYDYFSKIQKDLKDKIRNCKNIGVLAKLLWLDKYFKQSFKVQKNKIKFKGGSSTFIRTR